MDAFRTMFGGLIARLRSKGPAVRRRAAAGDGDDAIAPIADERERDAAALAPGSAGARQRRGIVPYWLPWAAGALAVVILASVGTIALWPSGAAVRVPDLGGLTTAEARERVQVLGLVLKVADTRFSASVPEGSVLRQSPAAGTIVAEGRVVSVDLSAGSEVFPMPDVIGVKLDAARRSLRERGLDVTFVSIPAQGDAGTVVSTVPSAGTTVSTGDTVQLSVAAGVGETGTVLPSDLTGYTFVLDPAFPPGTGTPDAPFEIARRVRALLESAHARVLLTRSITDTPDTLTDADRLRRSRETSATALIQLVIASSGSVGIQVQGLPGQGTPTAVYTTSKTLTAAIVTALRGPFPSTTSTDAVTPGIMRDFGGTAVRVRLGSAASPADKVDFSDAEWADSVARALYAAIARTYGRD